MENYQKLPYQHLVLEIYIHSTNMNALMHAKNML